ncbi:MAG: hypothetical protein QOJ84_5251 [Bradyrhizobium sp.]|jgi:hypothetical protein|nr:hypothetical protein [Bradyrhizobium sp.]
MPNGATPRGTSGSVSSRMSANGLKTVLQFQRVETQRYFDAAGFPGRTLGLEAEGDKQKRRGSNLVPYAATRLGLTSRSAGIFQASLIL